AVPGLFQVELLIEFFLFDMGQQQYAPAIERLAVLAVDHSGWEPAVLVVVEVHGDRKLPQVVRTAHALGVTWVLIPREDSGSVLRVHDKADGHGQTHQPCPPRATRGRWKQNPGNHDGNPPRCGRLIPTSAWIGRRPGGRIPRKPPKNRIQ